MMSFERIGPYALTRSDLVWASVIIGFSIGARRTKITSWVILSVGVMLIFAGLFPLDPYLIAAGCVLPIWIFIIAPAMRSLKASRDIFLSFAPEGLLADTPTMQTLYKWTTISKVRFIGSRLYVMVNGRCALVIGERVTTRDNIDAMVRTIAEHRG